MDDNKENVFETYDLIADWFAENRYQGLMEQPYLDRLIALAGAGATVLDLGCGTGLPMMGYLVKAGLQVTGVDASHRMLDIARKNFPGNAFIHADMRKLSLGKKFDAIIAWHSFFHLPPEDQPTMFGIFKAHLHHKGLLLFTSGTVLGEVWSINGGQNLFHGSLNMDNYRYLLASHGFEVLTYKENDPECGEATVWMVQLNEDD